MNERIIEEMVEEKTSKQWQRRNKYCLRIQKATQYKGDCDHEDVLSILVDYEKEIKKELIPENAVVQTKEQFDSFLEDYNQDLRRQIKLARKLERKETAEKIMNEISGDTLTISTRDYGSIEVVPLDRISEICENILKGDTQ